LNSKFGLNDKKKNRIKKKKKKVAVTWARETIFGPLTYYARVAQPPLLRALHPDSWGLGASQLAHLALHRFVGPSCHIYPSALGVLKTKSAPSSTTARN
jgi:hypothetical protein